MDRIVKIVILDKDANNADRIIRAVKSLGYAVRETIITTRTELEEFAKHETVPNIIIHNDCFEDIGICDTRSVFSAQPHEIPIIALASDISLNQSRLLNEGATIVLDQENDELIKLVISRTIDTEFYIYDLAIQAENYKELEQRYNKILDTSHDAICYIHEGLHTYANTSYLELFNIDTPEDASTLSILELVGEDDIKILKSILKEVAKNHSTGNITLNFNTGNGLVETYVEYNPVLVDGETCVQFVLHLQSNESRELQEQLSYISERDHETGFFHRKSLIEKIQDAIEEVHSGKQPHTYIQIDVANLDTIKDQYGVIAIDKLCSNIAEAMKQVCTDEDTLCKITDESFGILTALHEEEDLLDLGERLRRAIDDNPVTLKSQKVSAELYIGAAIIDATIEDVSDALSAAKSACDHAWEHELESLHLFKSESRSLTGTLLDQKWTQELQDAIREERLQLLYQPIVSITGNSDDRYQVYTQLVSKEGAKISVAELLPSIERSGVSAMLDRWVVKTALQRLAEHTSQSPNSLFFIKLTTGAINDQKFTSWLESQCSEFEVDPFRLVFDMREESIVSHLKDAKDFAAKLRQVGCQIAIDAFGISQEPGKILTMIPANYLKLSFQLMASLKSGDQERIESIKQICEEAKAKNTLTIAPFVESAESLSQIWTISIDFVSGDFFREPNENLGYDFSSAA